MAKFSFAGVKKSKKKAARNPSAAAYEIQSRKATRKASVGRKLGGCR